MIQNFEKLKEEQLKYKEKVEKLKGIVGSMQNSDLDLLKDVISISSCDTAADGLIRQLGNPNISISVVAEVAQGKSTFLNSLVFREQVLHSGAGAVTARLFKLDYSDEYSVTIGGNTKRFNNIDDLKKEVVDANNTIRKKMDSNKIASDEVFEVDVTLPHPSLKEGITIYDTPGFGSLDESIVYPLIQTAVAKSDAVIMLIDISQGLKRGEDKFVKDVLKSIPPNKRFVVFNKLDAVINDDMRVLNPEEEIADQLKKVEKDTLKALSEISGIPENEIVFYMLSSSKALAGFMGGDDSRLKESGFEEFEEDFWKRVIESKKEVFDDRIKNSRELIERCENRVEQVADGLNKNLNQLEKLKNALIENRAAFSAFSKQSIDSLDREIRSFNNDLSTIFDTEYMFNEIAELMENTVYDSLDEISWWDKMKVWNLKDKYVNRIETALMDMEGPIGSIVESYVKTIQTRLYQAQDDINKNIDKINENLASFDDLGVEPLDRVDILKKQSDGEISLNMDSEFSEYISVDKEVYVLIAGVVAEVIAGRLAMLIPGVGIAIAAAIAIIMKVYKSYNDPNKELAAKITQSIMDELESGLSVQVDRIKRTSDEIRNAMTTAMLTAKARIVMIQESFENPEEKQKEIEKIGSELEEIGGYIEEMKKLESI